jgi:selenocysteine-specific elongation factor
VSSPASFVLGTAGHVDHGKTALVRALTGVDTDRWKEEKERGITIDLGFARLPMDDGLTIAIVDVPGHEAFVRNMLAGASGLDAALLVIAADEGPMPQTLEHLAILDLMGITRAVVALTKMDLVDQEWAELVESEIADLLVGTTLEGSPVVPVSSVGDPGVAPLREALATMARDVAPRSTDDVFRMPIDRAFTVRGTGTVVTGTIWSGRARVGDTVHLTPEGEDARVRRIHAFGDEVTEAVAGTRAAFALTGIEKSQAPRGSTITSASWWNPTTLFTARPRTLPGFASLVPDQRVRVHIGTAEVMARIHPFGEVGGGGTDPLWAEVRLEAPVLVRGADRFVIRSYSPVTTIGGGVVLEPFPPSRRMRSTDPAVLSEAAGSPERRLDHALAVAGDRGMTFAELAIWTGRSVAPEDVGAESEGRGVVTVGDRLFSNDAFQALHAKVLDQVDDAHRGRPLDPGASLTAIRKADTGGGVLVGAVLDSLAGEGVVEVADGWVRRAGFEPTPQPDQLRVLDALRERLGSAGLEAPKLEELRAAAGAELAAEELEVFVAYLVRAGEALRLPGPGDFVLSAKAFHKAAGEIQATFGGQEGLGPADFREILPVSRRHLVPILSHMDVIGVTVRRENGRDVPAN